MTTTSEIWGKLSDPEYRKSFVASQINIGIPFQIRALMGARGWTQKQLAEKTGMRQPSISGLMTPGKTRPNIETLRRLAEAFDCAVAIRFVPFSELAEWSETFDPDNFKVSSFESDLEPVRHDLALSASQRVLTLAGNMTRANRLLPLSEAQANQYWQSLLSGGRTACANPSGLPASQMRLLDLISPSTSRKPPGVETESSQDRLGANGSTCQVIPIDAGRSGGVMQLKGKHADKPYPLRGFKPRKRAS